MDYVANDGFTLDDMIRVMLRQDYFIRRLSFEVKKLKGDLVCGVGEPVQVNRRLHIAKIKLSVRKRVVIGAAKEAYCEWGIIFLC